jgi:uncharacterized damage-inducible protein DinB
MSTRSYFAQRFAAEKPIFVKVFRAIPADKLDYRPHERSMNTRNLVWLLVAELDDACAVMRAGEIDFKLTEPPHETAGGGTQLDTMIERYEKNAAEVEKCLAALDDAAWEKPAKFMVGGKPIWETSMGDMLWGFLFDAIHHRGQLSTYLRPMGAKVPAIYGPSGDDPGGM